MAFISMFFVAIFLIVVGIGLFNLIVGIVLDIIWGVRKKKDKKIYVAHKVFAVILTVLGVLLGIVPLAALGVFVGVSKYNDYAEIKDIPEEDRVYINSDYSIPENGFDFRGDHYVLVSDISPQVSHEQFNETVIGTFIDEYNNHQMIYSVDNSFGTLALDVQYYSGLYIKESEADRFVSYYENEAPLYCQVVFDPAEYSHNIVENIDSDHVRTLVDKIDNEGYNYSYSESIDSEGYLYFYSTDDLCCIDISFYEGEDGLIVTHLSNRLVLDGEDEAFIRGLTSEFD